MKSSLSIVLSGLATASLLLVGCGGGGGTKEHDLAIKGDMTTGPTCIQVTTWPTAANAVGAFFQPDIDSSTDDDMSIQAIDPTANAEGNNNILIVELDTGHGQKETYPTTITFNSQTTFNGVTYGTGGTALTYILANFDLQTQGGGSGAELYLAQGGTLNITQADDSQTGGMAVTTSNLHLVQFTNAQPAVLIPNGKCYDVASASLSSQYVLPPDGGTDM
jgi:hypothetical protein